MKNVIYWFVIVAAIAAYFFYRKTQSKKRAKAALIKAKTIEPKSQYRCVVLEPCLNACKAAREMRALTMLMDVAPMLPLQACDTIKCSCKYIRHNDRRRNARRENLNVANQIIGNLDDKRERKDRRKRASAPS
jgi:hypothetical protein